MQNTNGSSSGASGSNEPPSKIPRTQADLTKAEADKKAKLELKKLRGDIKPGKGKKGQGKSEGKGKGKTKNKDSWHTVFNSKPICFKYGTKKGCERESCSMAHVCQICFGDHPLHKHNF